MSATRTGPMIFGVGTFLGAVITGATVAFFAGNANFQRNINFVPNGNSTGAVLQLNGVTEDQIFEVALTATGGNVKVSNGAKYNTAITASPLTTTGSITSVGIACGNVSKSFPVDVSFVKSRTSAGSGVALQNLNSVTLGTGAQVVFSTGSTAWNPVDFLKVNTLTTPGTVDCKLRVRLYDRYGR